MSQTRYPLDQIQVASPCSASWDAMWGDDRVRHCTQCGQNVYNLSALGLEEAQALVQEREGRLCVRFYRRDDGTMLTADCPVGLRAVRWAGRRARTLVGAALLTLLGAAVSGMTFLRVSKADAPPWREVEPFASIWRWLSPPAPPPLMGMPFFFEEPGPPPRSAPESSHPQPGGTPE